MHNTYIQCIHLLLYALHLRCLSRINHLATKSSLLKSPARQSTKLLQVLLLAAEAHHNFHTAFLVALQDSKKAAHAVPSSLQHKGSKRHPAAAAATAVDDAPMSSNAREGTEDGSVTEGPLSTYLSSKAGGGAVTSSISGLGFHAKASADGTSDPGSPLIKAFRGLQGGLGDTKMLSLDSCSSGLEAAARLPGDCSGTVSLTNDPSHHQSQQQLVHQAGYTSGAQSIAAAVGMPSTTAATSAPVTSAAADDVGSSDRPSDFAALLQQAEAGDVAACLLCVSMMRQGAVAGGQDSQLIRKLLLKVSLCQ